MAEARYTEEEIVTNMRDAGCSEKEIADFITLMKNGNEKQAFRILSRHREKLIENLHLARECIGCIDYLTYRMEQEK